MSTSKLEFAVDMAALRKAVNFTRNGLGNSKTDLSVMLFRFSVVGQEASLFASDKEVFVRGIFPVKNPAAKDGSFAVLGSKLEKLISQVDSELVKFEVDSENIQVNAGFLTVNFEAYDDTQLRATEMALVAEGAALIPTSLPLPRAALEEGLVCAKSCTTVNSIRPDLTHAEIRDGRLLSSDGRKILILTHDAFPKELVFKIPSVALNSAIGAIKNADAEAVVIGEGKSYYYLQAQGKFMLGVRKIERTFPKVEGMITSAEKPTDEISVDKLVLEAMVKGVALGLQTDDVKVTLDVVGAGSDAYLEVASLNSLQRRSHERASCGRTSEVPMSFPVSFKHLLDTLSVFKGDSVVDILVLTGKSILLVRDTTDDREVMTVIPFRTQAAIEAEKKDVEAAKEAREAAKPADGATVEGALEDNPAEEALA